MRITKTRAIRLGGLVVGGGAPVMVQSMTNTDTRDVDATLAQIERLAARGCEAVASGPCRTKPPPGQQQHCP